MTSPHGISRAEGKEILVIVAIVYRSGARRKQHEHDIPRPEDVCGGLLKPHRNRSANRGLLSGQSLMFSNRFAHLRTEDEVAERRDEGLNLEDTHTRRNDERDPERWR